MSKSPEYVSAEMVKDNSIEYRRYQVNLAAISERKNTLIVLSTGLGKTVIAALTAARRLKQHKGSKILFLAPSRPLVDQQARFLRRVLDIDDERVVCLTGHDSPEERKEIWEDARVIAMTPQALQNDLIRNSISLAPVSLLVYDEAHRGVGDYAYTFIAEKYEAQGENQRSLGLTASPGHEAEKIRTIQDNLRLHHVEVRSEKSKDVKDYLVSIDTDIQYITLPSEIEVLRDLLYSLMDDYREVVVENGFSLPSSRRLSRKDILRTQGAVRKEIGGHQRPPSYLFMVIKTLTALLRCVHLIEFVGTQGLAPTHRYVQGMHEEVLNKKSSKGVQDLIGQPAFHQFEQLLEALVNKGIRHPKADAIIELVSEQISVDLDSRILVFTRFRDTAMEVVETLENLDDTRVARFVGQSTRGRDKGLSQKEQVQILDGFRNNEYNVLVATQVGEEGLDIPECNLVVFYDCVPSVVPYIQRRGRTGRRTPGRVVIFVARNTHDEFYHWSVRSRLKKMPDALKEAERDEEEEQTSLDDFVMDSEKPKQSQKTTKSKKDEGEIGIIVDSRELPTSVARELSRLNVIISGETLEIGDYIVSEEVAVERKESEDFIQSMIDGRLFVQLNDLRSAYRRPVLIIEGEKIIGLRAVNPASIYGALASIAIRLRIPILWAHNSEETAHMLYRLAHMEQIGSKKPLRTRAGEAKGSDAEALEYILAGFPGIDTVTSRALLDEFGTLDAIFTADEAELKRVKGVGPKTAGTIRRLLTAKYQK